MERLAMALSAGSIATRGGTRRFFGLAFLSLFVPLTLLGPTAARAWADAEAIPGRGFLPDNRGWEMVSPLDKNGADISFAAGTVTASPGGERVSVRSNGAFDPAVGTGIAGVVTYVATRGADRWSLRSLMPAQDPSLGAASGGGRAYAFSGDLSTVLLTAFDPPLVPGAPENVANLYLRDIAGDSYQLLSPSVNPLPVDLFGQRAPSPADATPDFGHVIFEAQDNLTADASGFNFKLYEWDHGTLRLAGILPDSDCGSPPCPAESSVAGMGASYGHYTGDTISEDGSRIFFVDRDTGRLYARIGGSSTVWISQSEATAPSPTPLGATFQAASQDGTRVYFTTEEALVDADLDTWGDLYMYDFDAPSGERLSLISVDGEPGDADSSVQGVLGASDNGSYVYFAGTSALVPGQPALGEAAAETNLYLWHDGEVRHIAAVRNYEANWEDEGSASSYVLRSKRSRVTPDGRHLLYTAQDPQGSDFVQLYLYDAGTGAPPTCISCRPDGKPAGSDAKLAHNPSLHIPTAYLPRVLKDDGSSVFFDTADPLVLGDSNGKRDVYRWKEGRLDLISSGQGGTDSYLMEATPSGSDVFFVTADRLIPGDRDNNRDLYDARVNGGFPPPPPGGAPCEGDACQAPVVPPSDPTPASASFRGAGNPVPKLKKHRHNKKRSAKKRQKKRHKGNRTTIRRHG